MSAQRRLDECQRHIFYALRHQTTKDAFDADGLSIGELSGISAPGHSDVSMATTLLTIIISQQVAYFNVSKTMNVQQVAMAVDDIIRGYPNLTLEEVSTVFANYRRTAKLYDRLDPNILLGWIADYDRQRDEYCELRARRLPEKGAEGSASVMTYHQYVEWLKKEVAAGNPEAIKAKANHDMLSEHLQEPARKEAAFEAWRREQGIIGDEVGGNGMNGENGVNGMNGENGKNGKEEIIVER